MRPNPRAIADGLLEVRRSDCARFQNETAKDVTIRFLDVIALYMHFGNRKSDLLSDYEGYSSFSSASRSVRRHIAMNDFVMR
jgi:hypothetical protein